MTLSNISKGSYIDIFFVNQFSVLICPRVAKQIFKWRFWQMLETFTLQKSISKIDFRPLKKFWKVLYGQAGQDFKQPDLEKDVPDTVVECFSWSSKVPSSPNYYMNLWVEKIFLSSRSIQLKFSSLFKGSKENLYVLFTCKYLLKYLILVISCEGKQKQHKRLAAVLKLTIEC